MEQVRKSENGNAIWLDRTKNITYNFTSLAEYKR